MGLHQEAAELLNYLEQRYLLHGNVPTWEQAKIDLPFINRPEGITEDWFYNQIKREDFQSALKRRGMEHLPELSPKARGNGVLTPEQLACVNLVLDVTDTRQLKRRLDAAGISTQKYQNWLRDPVFQAYLRQRSENLLPDSTHEVHAALVSQAASGDSSAMKLYYEMTGRWSSKTVGELNVEFLLMKIIEAVQKHVADAEIVAKIAEELATFATAPALTNTPAAVASTSKAGVPANQFARKMIDAGDF